MRWVAVFPVMVAVLAGFVFGSQQEPSSVTGRVLTPDGKPAANATVWLVVHRWGQERLAVESIAQTDSNGRFRLNFTPPLRVHRAYVIAHYPKFAVGWSWFDPRELKPITVRLNRTAPLGGIIVTPDGQPLPNAKVQVISLSISHRSLPFQPEHQLTIFIDARDIPQEVTPFWATSDESGRFAFNHLPTGASVTLLILHPDFSPVTFPPQWRWFPVQTGRTDFIIPLAPKTVLAGLVLRDGKPVAKARVICGLEGEDLKLSTDEEGRFETVLPAGGDPLGFVHVVHAIAEDGQWQSEPVLVRLEPGSKHHIILNLTQAFEVRGTVKDEKTKKPVPFEAVTPMKSLKTPEIQTTWRMEEVKTDEQGNFRIFLLPGEWTLNAWASYKPGHAVFTETKIIVKDGTVNAPDLLLQERLGGRLLTVQVVDSKGRAVANAIVTDVLRGESKRTDKLGRTTITFPAISYFFGDGRGVSERILPVWASTPDLSAFGMVVPKPDSKSVRIAVRPGVPVSGQVVDEKGRPVPNAKVCLQVMMLEEIFPGRSSEMPRDWFEVSADAKGRFRCFVPADQAFMLLASAPNFFPTQTKRLVARTGKPLQVTIKMIRPDTTFEGVVVDAETGNPVVGAFVSVSHRWVGDWFFMREYAMQFTFTDFNGRFKLTGIRKDHIGEVAIWHLLYTSLALWRPKFLPQGRIALERLRPKIAVELEKGKPTPPLSDVRWLEGEPPSLQGITTYLLFASPMESSCEQVLQRLKQVHEQGQGKVRVVVVFDASLPENEVRQYVQELKLPFHFGIVPQGKKVGWDSETFQRYGVTSVPKLVVINERGVVTEIDLPVEKLSEFKP